MKRYYDPEIFLQMLDGIDLDNHVVASYYLHDRLEGRPGRVGRDRRLQ